MQEITARVGTKEPFIIPFPTSLSEIDLSSFCDTVELAEEHDELIKEAVEEKIDLNNPDFKFRYISLLGRIVAAFTGCKELKAIMSLPLGDYDHHLKEFFKVESLQEIDLEGMEGSLLTLFANVMKVISSYEFEVANDDKVVVYRGKRFTLRLIEKNRITKKDMPSDLSAQEAIEILDLQRKLDSSKDSKANRLFTQFTYQLAVLCREGGEELPTDQIEFNHFVEGRQIFFTGEGEHPAIDAKTALDIDFFFGGRLGLVSRIIPLLISGMPQNQALKVVLRKWQNRLQRLNRRIIKSSTE